ncbi:MAG: VWA domain-containing protein [Methanomicrobiales archaeon]
MVPDNITFKSEDNWVVANGADSTRLTITVYNQTIPMNETKVSFLVNSSEYGTIESPQVTTKLGKATTNFTTAYKSGTARITATISYRTNDTDLSELEKTVTLDQNIDHDIKITCTYLYNSSVTVGTGTPITFTFRDQHGNPIDNRRNDDTHESLPPEQMKLDVSLPDMSHVDRAGFWDGTLYHLNSTINLDLNGTVSSILFLDTTTGTHYLHATPANFKVAGWQPDGATSSDHFFLIHGIANGEPWYLTRTIFPSVKWVYADGIQHFTIDYVLKDRYGNGLENSRIDVDTLERMGGAESKFNSSIYTNSVGEATVSYGPKQKLTSWVTSTAAGNISLRYVDVVEFKNTTPTDMLLTASPQTLASRDAIAWSNATVSAKVMDSQGAGTSGQTVNFTLVTHNSYPAGSIITQSKLNDDSGVHDTLASAVTDENGYATIEFYPGYFNSSKSKDSTEYSDVYAEWTTPDTTDKFNLSVRIWWKNYPYLSVSTSISPTTVNVTDTVDVTIYLKGDGYAFTQFKPIDVMLCTDRSGSMLQNTTHPLDSINNDGHHVNDWIPSSQKNNFSAVKKESTDDRMVLAMRAQTAFVKKMNSAQDKLGLVTFGTQTGTVSIASADADYKHWAGADYVWDSTHSVWVDGTTDDVAYISKSYPGNGIVSYSNNGNLDKPLTGLFSVGQMCDVINKTVPAGGTPTREGIWRAVKELNSKSTNTIQAVILLTDGGWKDGGDPRGLVAKDYTGTTRTLTSFTSEGGPAGGAIDSSGNKSVIKWAAQHGIKIYTIAVGNESSVTQPELQAYATETNAKFYNAASADQLEGIYDDIAKVLQEEAGADVYTNLTFDEVKVDTIMVPATDEFSYVSSDQSTMVKQFHDKTSIWNQNLINQKAEWEAGSMNFSIGKMLVNDIWQATFRLRVINESGGNIKIFSPDYKDSYISFVNNGVLSKLYLPDTYITAKADLKSTGIQQATLDYESSSDPVTVVTNDKLRFTWTRNYTGTKQLFELYEVSIDGMNWLKIGERTLSGADAKNPKGEYILDLTNLPSNLGSLKTAGGIEFRVTGRAPDVGSPEYWKPPRFILQQARGKIILE